LLRLLAALPVAASLPAFPQAYPSRPITLIVPYSTGGPTDAAARVVTEGMSKILGQQFVLTYKPGAATIIGTELVKAAPKDGYTLLLGSSTTFSLNPIQYRQQLKYRLEDFEAIGGMAKVPYGLVVSNRLPAKNLREFIAWAKAQPKGFSYGTVGQGSSTHVGGAMLARAIGATGVAIHYKGSAGVQADLLGDSLDVSIDPMTTAIPMHKGGKVRLIGMLENERWSEAPDVQTFAEQGLKGVEVPGYFGLLAPVGVPADVIATLTKALTAVVTDPVTVTRLHQVGLVPAVYEGDKFWKLLRSQEDWWRSRIEENNIRFAE